jgi:hypothetical protein
MRSPEINDPHNRYFRRRPGVSAYPDLRDRTRKRDSDTKSVALHGMLVQHLIVASVVLIELLS